MINNENTVGVYTDYGIATILGNFSDDMVGDIVRESLEYRFRPFALRAPNYPEIIQQQLDNVKLHSTGYDNEIEEQRVATLNNIINTILEYYQLTLTIDIPDEQLYTFCYILYQIFVSEFTERMTNFFTQYILNNIDSIINQIKADNGYKITKNNPYSKKIYNTQDLELIYENMSGIVNILSGLDIPLPALIASLSDVKTSNFLCSYIVDTGDIYKNHYAKFLLDQTTSAAMITKIRLQYVKATIENTELLNPDTNPYIKEKKK